MDEEQIISEANLDFSVPVKIAYPVLDKFLKQKLIGEIISKDGSQAKGNNYAQILDISVQKSEIPGFDLCLDLSLQTLTTFFKNKHLRILFHASLELDREEQRIFLKDYTADGQSKSWLADQMIETLVNKLMYAKLKKKLNFEFMPHIRKNLDELNEKLENEMEARKGVHILGAMRTLEISGIKFGENDLWVYVKVQGSGLVEIKEIKLP